MTSIAQPTIQQFQPGLQQVSTIPGLVQPQVVTSVMLPATSSHQVGQGYLVPSSLGTTVTAGQPPQQIIVQGQPPPQLQTQIQLAQPHLGPPPPVSSPGPNGPVPPPLVTTIQPELQLVSQPAPLPLWGSPAVQAPVQHSVFSQMPGSNPGPVSMMTSLPTNVTLTSVSLTGNSYSPPTREEPQKRRFTEEKQEDKVPENLLGYEHGPPHLTNLVVQGPPPGHMPPASEPQQFQMNAPPPPHMQPPPGPHGIPLQQNMVSVASPVTSMSEENRYTQSPQGQLLGGGDPESADSDKKLMPPPALPHGIKRPLSDKNDGSGEKKKHKGALRNVTAAYGSDEEEDDLNKQQLKEAKKYQYNQYSNPAQLYGQEMSQEAPPSPVMPAGLPPTDQYGQSLIHSEQIHHGQPPPQNIQIQEQMGPPPGQYPPLQESPSQQIILQPQEIHQQLQVPYQQQQPPYSIALTHTSSPYPPPHSSPSSTIQYSLATQTINVSGPPPPLPRLDQLPPPPGQRLGPEDLNAATLGQSQLGPPPPQNIAGMPPQRLGPEDITSVSMAQSQVPPPQSLTGLPPPPPGQQYGVPIQQQIHYNSQTPPPPQQLQQGQPPQAYSPQQPYTGQPPPPPPGMQQPPPGGVPIWMTSQ